VAVNGKTRTTMNFDVNASQSDIEAAVLADPMVSKWLEGKPPKKIIYVRNKMINVVI
jgi:leucyl-tRNA synthetase